MGFFDQKRFLGCQIRFTFQKPDGYKENVAEKEFTPLENVEGKDMQCYQRPISSNLNSRREMFYFLKRKWLGQYMSHIFRPYLVKRVIRRKHRASEERFLSILISS